MDRGAALERVVQVVRSVGPKAPKPPQAPPALGPELMIFNALLKSRMPETDAVTEVERQSMLDQILRSLPAGGQP
jgi:hypothetical protein